MAATASGAARANRLSEDVMCRSPVVSIASRHGNVAGPCDNHAENAKKSCLFAPRDGGQTVAGSVLFYSAGDPTSGLCWLSQGQVWGFAIDQATPLGGSDCIAAAMIEPTFSAVSTKWPSAKWA